MINTWFKKSLKQVKTNEKFFWINLLFKVKNYGGGGGGRHVRVFFYTYFQFSKKVTNWILNFQQNNIF